MKKPRSGKTILSYPVAIRHYHRMANIAFHGSDPATELETNLDQSSFERLFFDSSTTDAFPEGYFIHAFSL